MSKEDKELVVVKKNIFGRILTALLNGLKRLFKVKPDNTEELAKAEQKIEELEGEIKSIEDEEKRLDKEAKRDEKQKDKELEETEEIEGVPKPLPGIDKFPSYLSDKKVDEKNCSDYTKFLRDVGVDFKVPEEYFMEYPINENTIDIVNNAKKQMKQKEELRPRIEMKENTRE